MKYLFRDIPLDFDISDSFDRAPGRWEALQAQPLFRLSRESPNDMTRDNIKSMDRLESNERH